MSVLQFHPRWQNRQRGCCRRCSGWRVEVNDPASKCVLASHYKHGLGGLQQDRNSRTISSVITIYEVGMKKARFHYEVAAMSGHEMARNNMGVLEANSRHIV